MPTITTRITAGPLERFLLADPDIYPNEATAEMALEQLHDLRTRRSAGRGREYPVLAIQAGGLNGRLAILMLRTTRAQIMGTTGDVDTTLIRMEFDRFTISESQIRERPSRVARELVLGTDSTVPDTVAGATIGTEVGTVIDLPAPIGAIFEGLIIESARVRGDGTAYGFAAVTN